jgi:hypothetical protein
MIIRSPRLLTAALELEPGTIKIDWLDESDIPRSLDLYGADAERALDHFKAATSQTAKVLLLRSIIQGGAHVV